MSAAKRPPDLIRQYELVDLVRAYDPDVDEAFLNRAYVFAMQAHGEQTRSSGDPYFSHPLAVAAILTELRLDAASIATALLHDVVEDTDVTLAEIEERFGHEVAQLVDGVTKISKQELAPDADGKAENFAKFLLATAKDIRVLLVKLADRLHNMRTLDFVKPEKQERIARETMEIYAPMAERIGLQAIREELEDLSFRYINPSAYETITQQLREVEQRATPDVIAVAHVLRRELAKANVEAEVYSRQKRAFSVWSKMRRKRNTFDELADIYAFRVIVANTEDCYRALGVIHQSFPMIQQEFDDYISTPKQNGYRSIHTAVIASKVVQEGQRVEVQIRSKEMHEIAERGIAAHWRYKEATAGAGGARRSLEDGKHNSPYEWLRGMLQTLVNDEERGNLLDQAKIDLYQDQVFPFTPKGRVVPLPVGATVLDFAYSVHTEVGDSAIGARINGANRPIRSRVRNGDVVQVLTSSAAPIPSGWESFVVTGAARSGIRRKIRSLRRQEQTKLGERIISATFAARDLAMSKAALEKASKKLGYDNLEALYRAAAKLEVAGRDVLKTVYPGLDLAEAHETAEHPLRTGERIPRRAVSIAGMTPGGAVRLGECCSPLPGERIVGIRQDTDDVITVHRIDCEKLDQAQDSDWLNLQWSDDIAEQFVAPIILTANNKTGALGHIGSMLARYGADIVDLKLGHREVDFYDLCFDIAVRDARHLASVLAGLRASDYVVSVDRREGTTEC